jgi:probable rRNA maturation factor
MRSIRREYFAAAPDKFTKGLSRAFTAYKKERVPFMLTLLNFPSEYYADMARVYGAALSYLKQRDIFETEVSCLSRRKIKSLNKLHRGVDKVTDVLSFPALEIKTLPVKKRDFKADLNPENGLLTLGEIAVCGDKVREQAEKYGHSYLRELCYLFLHGLLHLFGFDHGTEDAEAVMRKIEEDILRSINITRDRE